MSEILKKFPIQVGTSASADFEKRTWTFEMDDENFPVKAGRFTLEPIEYTANKLKVIKYWKERCEFAEACIKASPCDPDITPAQIKATTVYEEFLKSNSLEEIITINLESNPVVFVERRCTEITDRYDNMIYEGMELLLMYDNTLAFKGVAKYSETLKEWEIYHDEGNHVAIKHNRHIIEIIRS